LELNCNWLFHPSLSFHTKYDYPGLINLVPDHKEIQPDQGATFYYAQPEDMDQLKGKYDVVWAINGGHRFLLRLKK
jgi:hypothetical protein